MVLVTMRLKLTILSLTLLIFSSMNIYSRALRHISIKDVKQKHQEKVLEKIQKEVRKKEERQYIQSVMETKKYDWRKELNEQMTTSDVFFTNLPATGDIEYPISDNIEEVDPEGGISVTFDTSLYDTLVIDVELSGDKFLGVFSSTLELLLVISSSGTHSLSVGQSKQLNLKFLVSIPGEGSVAVTGIRAKRKTPLNVFVSLDSPEATSFIRTDPMMSNLSPAEREKKLREMLASGDEYVEKMLGSDFPGTGAVPPGEYDPFKQAPAGEAGDTPGVDVSNFDTSKMEKDYGQVAGSMNTPSGAIKAMQGYVDTGLKGNYVTTTVNGQRFSGYPAQIINQIKSTFPGGV
jgi:hypothetical protein